jgi:SAM-dependent methyltransferase
MARSFSRQMLQMMLFNDYSRFVICKTRWFWLKKNMRFLQQTSESVGTDTIAHNLNAFNYNAVFGMGRRMSLLLFPTAAVLKDRLDSARVLIVGPRSEDDIFWAKALGLRNTIGIDLFSYSPFIRLADIHESGLPSRSYDAVLLAWMISYSSDPARVVEECKNLLKPGGYLGIGIESNPAQKVTGVRPPRVNSLNSTADLIELVRCPVVFSNEPYEDVVYDCAVIFKVREQDLTQRDDERVG